MKSWQIQFLKYLKEDFDRRRSANHRFSLRAFAKKLGVAPASLTEAFKEERGWNLSRERAKELLGYLDLTVEQKNALLVEMGFPAKHEVSVLEPSSYEYLKSPRHLAVLAAAYLPKKLRSLDAIAERFGFGREEAAKTIQSLEEQSLLSRDDDGDIEAPSGFVESVDGPSDSILRKHHHMVLGLASKSLETIPANERDVTSLSFVGNSKALAHLRAAIRELENNASSLTYGEDGADTVYQLCIQVFPVDKRLLRDD